MSINEISFALITGIVSAVFYSGIQAISSYLRWLRTRRYFLSRISEHMTFISYHLMTILDIDPIYETEFESDHLMTDDEFILAIQNESITNEQWANINKLVGQTTNLITVTRKEGFLIPTYTANDFHAVDTLINEMRSFTSSYSWLNEELDDPDITNRLKAKLITIIKLSKDNPFPNKFLDRVYNKYRTRVLRYKNRNVHSSSAW